MSSAKSFHENFYGTPTEDESRRRRGKKRRSKTLKEEPQNEVSVIGVHYRSFDDDSMAAFVNSATALVPWNGDPKLLIDRYDVRHLLQDLTGIRRRRARPPSPDATKEELDYERYRDVEGLENPSSQEDDLKNEDGADGGYQRVAFNYSAGGDQASRKERVEDVLFSPPFFVPEHLRAQIPTSTKLHQIMAGTAKYVIEHGGQAEIVLRVKQANNPTFGFLMPDHNDHEYFRFLVAHPEYVGIPPLQQEQPAVPEVAAPTSSDEAEGGLSLLGTAYGDADEDEDEEEGKEVGVLIKGPAEEPQLPAADDAEKVDDVKEHVDLGATRSSPINRTASEGAENATKDTGDSLEVSLETELPVTAGQSSETFPDGMIDPPSPASQEPVPPGMEASSSGVADMDGHESHGQRGEQDHQVVPPYKEPPLRLRLIINKMVEFIARNGKEFEAIVKERDKTDHRFPFFLPWNEYHPYYVKELEAATQAEVLPANGVAVTPSASEPPTAPESQEAEGRGERTDSFLSGVRFWDISQAAESNGGNAEVSMADIPEGEEDNPHNEDNSHNGEGGIMDFDAVLAAVRFATRGRPQSAEGNQDSDLRKGSDGNELPEIGSDEAVLAAIKAATGRTKLDPSVPVTDKETSLLPGSLSPAAVDTKDSVQSSTGAQGAAVSDVKDPTLMLTLSRIASMGESKNLIQTSPLSRNASVGDSSDLMGTATALSQSAVEALAVVGEDGAVAPIAVTTAAAVVSPAEDRDSAEPQLVTAEKRKAERLKKAKLFAAMIKDKNGILANPAQLPGSLGLPAPNLDRLNDVSVALESTTVKSGGDVPAPPADVEPEKRDSTGDTQVHVAAEAEKELANSSAKQKKPKVTSKDHEEKKRKHHQKRKKDTEEKEEKEEREEREDSENERKPSPSTAEKRRDKHHDHYQDGKRKERKHGRESDGKARDSSRHREGKVRSEEGVHGLDDWADEDYEERRRERSYYAHDSEGRRKESKYAYEAEQKRRRDRHGQDSERIRKESRHGYESEEDRRLARQRYDSDRKRKESRHRHESEERRSRDRYDYDSEAARRERSRRQEKRKKELADESDEKESRRKKSKPHGDDLASATKHTVVERQSTHHRDPKDDTKVVSPVKHDAMPQTSTAQTSATRTPVGEAKPKPKPSTLSDADVPDDIRAKVRAMLAMM